MRRSPAYAGDWVIVERYLSYTEVHLLRSCLEAAGVPAEVADAQLVQTDPLLSPAMRGASLRVPEKHLAEAREVIAAFHRGDFALGEDFEPDRK
jgi:putative signal transducing protein